MRSKIVRECLTSVAIAAAASFHPLKIHRSIELLAVSKVNHAAIVGVLTVHCPVVSLKILTVAN